MNECLKDIGLKDHQIIDYLGLSHVLVGRYGSTYLLNWK